MRNPHKNTKSIYKIRAIKGSEIRDFYFSSPVTMNNCAKELKSIGYTISITRQ